MLNHKLNYPTNLLFKHINSQIVLDGLVSFLQTALGDSLSEEGCKAWKKLVNNIMVGIDQELEVLKAETENDGE